VKRIFVLIAAALAAVVGSIGLWAGVASAHHPIVSGQTPCLTGGTWTVHWTVSNSESAADRIMTFDSATVAGVPVSLSPGHVPANGSASGTSTYSAATQSATLIVAARWTYTTPNVTASGQYTVAKPAACVQPTTTTTVAPTTTTVAPTTTTVAPTTTTVAPTTTTVAPTTSIAVDPTTSAPAVTTSAPEVDDTTSHRVPVTPPPALQVAAVQVSAATPTNLLPATGTSSLPLVAGAAGLLLGGAGLVMAARRRGATV
jgi:LPXTG-motif cell wall-anchored protein